VPYRSFNIESFVHVIQRGGRGQPIVEDKHDKWRFLQLLRYFNTAHSYKHWQRDIDQAGAEGKHMPWPESWADADPLVAIQAFCLMPNHFHLLVKEIQPGGIAKFMECVGKSMSGHYNRRHGHGDEGSIFSGPYKSQVVADDVYMRYLIPYITVKNPLELHPDSLFEIADDFSKAYRWACQYPFSSLSDFTGSEDSPITALDDVIADSFEDAEDFKNVAEDCLRKHTIVREIGNVMLEKY